MTMKRVIWCSRCREIFPPPQESGSPNTLKCPACDETLGIVWLESRRLDAGEVVGPAPWEFVCHACALYFEVTSPADPDEAERIACPQCGRRDIERLHICSLENMGHTCFG